jgi:alanine dehydrogenase
MPYIEEITNKGTENAIRENDAIAKAVNTHNGELDHLTLLSIGGDDGLD